MMLPTWICIDIGLRNDLLGWQWCWCFGTC